MMANTFITIFNATFLAKHKGVYIVQIVVFCLIFLPSILMQNNTLKQHQIGSKEVYKTVPNYKTVPML